MRETFKPVNGSVIISAWALGLFILFLIDAVSYPMIYLTIFFFSSYD